MATEKQLLDVGYAYIATVLKGDAPCAGVAGDFARRWVEARQGALGNLEWVLTRSSHQPSAHPRPLTRAHPTPRSGRTSSQAAARA